MFQHHQIYLKLLVKTSFIKCLFISQKKWALFKHKFTNAQFIIIYVLINIILLFLHSVNEIYSSEIFKHLTNH